MKVFIVLAALVACAMAKPGFVYSSVAGYPYTTGVQAHGYQYAHAPAVTYSSPAVTYAAPAVTYASPAVTYAAPAVTYSAPAVVPVATRTQYHSQTESGQASYGYSHEGQAHAAVRDAAGNVQGSYAYASPAGPVRVDYVADHNGYRVASNALPQGPAAGIQETPEVAAARAEHLRAHHEVKSRQRRGVVYSSPLTYATYPYGTQHAYTYNASPLTYTSGLTYAATPVNTYVHTPAHTYSTAVVGHPLREATLTKVVNNPGHAVSYRVD